MKKRILFLANHFITLFSFRRELIQQLVNSGYDVYLSIPTDDQNCFFADMGCTILETNMSRRGMNPLQDFKLVLQYRKMLRRVKPNIVFSYTVKPNIYGCLASHCLGYRQICNVTGTGATFLKESILSKIVRMLYRFSFRKAYKVFFQNAGDRDYFLKYGLVKSNYHMLPGSGVNLDQHIFSEIPPDDIVNFIFVGRVMGVKGIAQYLDCAKTIRQDRPNTCFYIAGFHEEEKYQKMVEEYHKAGYVNYIGFQKNIDEWIERCHCTILPSLGGEGVPNVLLESAAVGRACIASDISGSRDVIDDGVTGYLFETGSSQSLIEKVNRFLELPLEEKRAMGRAGRRKVEQSFDRKIVMDRYQEEVAKV